MQATLLLKLTADKLHKLLGFYLGILNCPKFFLNSLLYYHLAEMLLLYSNKYCNHFIAKQICWRKHVLNITIFST